MTIADPFIELHTGPGQRLSRSSSSPSAASRSSCSSGARSGSRFAVARGQEGWVHFEQLTTTLNPDGEPFDLPALGFSDYTARRWEVGALYGDFGGANVIGAYGSRSFTPNLSGELWVSQALGRFSDSTMVTVEHRPSHVSGLARVAVFHARRRRHQDGAQGDARRDDGSNRFDSRTPASASRTYLTRRFVFRAEYKTHVVFTSRDDNEEVQEWKAGFSFFF